MKTTKHILSVLLVLLICTLFFGREACDTANAAGTHTTHCVCGGTYADCNHEAIEGDWIAWDGTTYITESGNYYLTAPITSQRWLGMYTYAGEERLVINLCLNGISCDSAYRVFGIGKNVTVNLMNCSETTSVLKGAYATDPGRVIYIHSSDAILNMYGNIKLEGKETNGRVVASGGAIYCRGTFNMYGGEVVGSYVGGGYYTYSDGAYIYGTYEGKGGVIDITATGVWNLYGGTVYGGSGGLDPQNSNDGTTVTTRSLGGVAYISNGGQFNMYDGTVYGGTVADGGVVYLTGDDAKFNMSGGTIYAGYAQFGGGVAKAENNADIVMSGGVIDGRNSLGKGYNAGGAGGGAFMLFGGNLTVNGTAEIRNCVTSNLGGAIKVIGASSTVTLGGNAKIYRNGIGTFDKSTTSNIHLIDGMQPIVVEDTVTADACFGISMTTPGVFTSAAVSETAAKAFFGDTNLVSRLADGTLTLTQETTDTFSGFCGANGNNLTWILLPNGQLIISGTGAMANDSPWPGQSVKHVTIADGVTTIGDCAFLEHEQLVSVTIPDSVTTIGEAAFALCANLTSVTIPDSVTTIGEFAFCCFDLTSLTIGKGVTKIGADAFAGCVNLDTVYIADLAAWCAIQFGRYWENPDPYPLFHAKKVYFNNQLTTELTIPADVTVISPYAFYGFSTLTKVTVPSGVTSIGDGAFGHCTNLTDVHYDGTRTQWNAIAMGQDNEYLTEATVICFEVDILSQPADQNIVQGKRAQFKVEAYHDYALSYQWQYSTNDGATWTDSSAATQGYNTNTLTVDGILGRSGYSYRCRITTEFGKEYYTEAAKLTVSESVLFVANPTDQTVKMGGSAVFAAAVNDAEAVYRWQYSKNGGDTWLDSSSATAGYNTDTLTVVGTQARNGFLYRCKVTDTLGNTIYSEPAMLTVQDTVTFVSHPADETVKLGNRAAFTVETEGEAAAYQWQYQMVKNGPWWNCTPYTMGYNTLELNVIAAEKRQGFLYRCRVTDTDGNKFYSNTAVLTVDIPEVYAVLTQPQNAYVLVDGKTTFHIDTQGEGLTYQWEYHKGVDKTGPEYYWIPMGSTTGCKTDTLTVAAVSGSINRDGWAYRCVVTDSQGYIYTTDYAFLYISGIQITSQPEDVNVPPGSTAVFHVEVTGEADSFQWQYSKDGGKSWYNSSSATQGYNTDTLTVASVSGSTNRNGFLYRCIITDAYGNRIETYAARLSVE